MFKMYPKTCAATKAAGVVEPIGKVQSRRAAAKSLLLGSTAAVVAAFAVNPAAAQGKPVEYVKVCSLYGDGFYYIPGTDTCVRVGGSMQADYYYNALSNGHILYNGAQGAQDRSVSAGSQRARVDMAFDARTQTEYGTLRTFVQARIENGDGNVNTLNQPRGFIQWAGFTFGHTRSYAEPYGGWGGGGGFSSLFQAQTGPDTDTNGINQISYTWELGNGSALILGADERRNNPLVNLSNAGSVAVGNIPTTSRAGMVAPDPYVGFKVSQAWGRFSTALHASQNTALYYTAATPGFACAQPGTTLCEHPADKWGWAAISGVEIKMPWVAPGDRLGGFFSYGVGATKWSSGFNLDNAGLFGGGNNVALGFITDGVYLNGLSIQQTTSWAVAAAYEHWWTPQFSSTVYGTVAGNNYNSTVVNGGWFCGKGGAGAQGVTQVNPALVCDPSFRYSSISAQTSWYPVPAFRLGVEVMYTTIDTAFDAQQVLLTKTSGQRPTGVYTARDQGIVSAAFRAQRTFPVGE